MLVKKIELLPKTEAKKKTKKRKKKKQRNKKPCAYFIFWNLLVINYLVSARKKLKIFFFASGYNYPKTCDCAHTRVSECPAYL